MGKANITLPKGFVCKDGTCLDKELDFDVDIPETKPVIQMRPDPTITLNNQMQQLQQQMEIPKAPEPHTHEDPKDPHEVLAENMPKGMNFGKCANGECGKKVKNKKGITKDFKECRNCGANTVPKDKNYCPYCGIDEDKEDPFDDSNVKLEDEE